MAGTAKTKAKLISITIKTFGRYAGCPQ